MAEQGEPRPGLASCYRHPEQETGISCTRCDRPICTECMISASVGYQCPECVRGASASTRASQPKTIAGGAVVSDTRLVTKILLAVNAAVFVAVLAARRELVLDLGMLGYAIEPGSFSWVGVASGEWYRLLTSAFLHEQFLHIAFNMLGLWFLGPPLEAALGRSRFIALYLVSALAGSTLSYLLAAQNQLSLGASGAIFGLFGATAVLMRRLNYDMRPIAVLLAINLVFTFTWANIAWQAHIGGLVAGSVMAYAMVHAPREKRQLVQYGTGAALLLVILVTCVVRTVQLLG